jgi:hypothetical protein
MHTATLEELPLLELSLILKLIQIQLCIINLNIRERWDFIKTATFGLLGHSLGQNLNLLHFNLFYRGFILFYKFINGICGRHCVQIESCPSFR